MKHCKGITPDSFVQVSLALAYFRDTGKEIPITYESASTRKFLHGRTECIRPQSTELVNFLNSFDDKTANQVDLAALARAAGKSHRKYTKICTEGNGVDRHLLALRMLSIENKVPLPSLFTDFAYLKSTNFTLSTSQVCFLWL